MLYFAYCMNKNAKSEEESLTKVCVDFNIKNNTNTEPQQGRLDLKSIRCADQKYANALTASEYRECIPLLIF